jgi:probable rRNA maturation factor
MAYTIDIQHAISKPIPISDMDISCWVSLALENRQSDAELTIRFVELSEMSELNRHYRKKQGPTNVLSFPSELPKELSSCLPKPFLGDIIICPEVLCDESIKLNKSLREHWAHIIIHGVLHLLGHDHMQADEEKLMQSIEIRCLQQLGFSNPYNEYD